MPGQHGDAAAADADLGQRVEVRRVGRFELGQAARLLRQAAEAVGRREDDLGVVLDVQFAGEVVDVHGSERLVSWLASVSRWPDSLQSSQKWAGSQGAWSGGPWVRVRRAGRIS